MFMYYNFMRPGSELECTKCKGKNNDNYDVIDNKVQCRFQ